MRVIVIDDGGSHDEYSVMESLWVPLHALLIWAQGQENLVRRPRRGEHEMPQQKVTPAQRKARRQHARKKKAHATRQPTYESPPAGTLGNLARSRGRKKKKTP